MISRWWKFIWSALAAGILFFHGFSYSEKAPNYMFVHEATWAPATAYYDYIIIGGGTCGCPLAATLSQNATVLLLERGGSPYGNDNITEMDSFGNSLFDDSSSSPSQFFLSQDGVFNARARVLGGGTALNAGFYTRASMGYVKEVGWDQSLVNRSYEWVENKVAFEPRVMHWQSAVRDGLIEASVTPFNGFTYDHIYGTKVGGTIFDWQGHRHTAADLLEYAIPNNITLLLHARVQRILFKLKDTVMTIWHYHGGCQVGRVVDKKYKVIGVDALRVIDGSTFIRTPGANPQATIMMLGRYMGERILQERLSYERK